MNKLIPNTKTLKRNKIVSDYFKHAFDKYQSKNAENILTGKKKTNIFSGFWFPH
jgi:hypothetical protein